MSGRLVESFLVNATLTVQRVVMGVSSTANTVGLPDTTGVLPLGITIDDVKDTTGSIAVQVNGKAKLFFNDTCVSGKLVGFDTSGRGVPFTPAATTTGFTLSTGVIGTLLDADIAATGTVAHVLINPNLIR
jgi:hypothetical protein